MHFTSRERTILFITALFVITVLGTRFLIIPALSSVKETKIQLEVARQEEQRVSNLLAKIDTIDADIDQMLVKTQEVSAPFFTTPPIEYVHRWIVDKARSFNVKVTSLSFGEPIIGSVAPYSVVNNQQSYSIADYYNNMVNATQNPVEENAQNQESIQEQNTENPNATDAVITYQMNLGVEGSKTNVMRYVEYINTLDKHSMVTSINIPNFEQDGIQAFSLPINLYGILKDDDGVLAYNFQ